MTTSVEVLKKDGKPDVFLLDEALHFTIATEQNKTVTRLDPGESRCETTKESQEGLKRLSACRKPKPARKPEISNLKNMPNTNAEVEKIRNTINYAELGINVRTSPKNIPL